MNNKNIYSICKKLLKNKYNSGRLGCFNPKFDEVQEIENLLKFIVSRIELANNGKITLSFCDSENKKVKTIEISSLKEMFKELIKNKEIISNKNVAEQYEQICSIFLKE